MYRKSENLKNALLGGKYQFSEILQWRENANEDLEVLKGQHKIKKKPETLGHEP